MFRDKLGDKTRVEIIDTSRGGTGHESDGLALVKRSLGLEVNRPCKDTENEQKDHHML
jgi:hypothetical protein